MCLGNERLGCDWHLVLEMKTLLSPNTRDKLQAFYQVPNIGPACLFGPNNLPSKSLGWAKLQACDKMSRDKRKLKLLEETNSSFFSFFFYLMKLCIYFRQKYLSYSLILIYVLIITQSFILC